MTFMTFYTIMQVIVAILQFAKAVKYIQLIKNDSRIYNN